MAFPTVANSSSGRFSSGTSDATPSIPTGGSVGDLVVFLVSVNQDPITIAATGWTSILADTSSSINASVAVLARKLDGSEGSTISIARPTACSLAYASYLITGWHGTSMPEAADVAASVGNSPDSPSLSPSWGADDTLWIAGATRRSTGSISVTFPTNYTSDQITAGGAGVSCYAITATRQLNASSEDPDPWTTTSPGGFGITIAVRPAAAGGTNYTLTAAAGSFALSGQAAGLRADRKMAAAAGAFAMSGQTAGLRADRRVAASAGSFALTGQAAALRAARRLPTTAGAFAMTGVAAGLRAARVLAAGVGSFSLTGFAAGLTKSGGGAYTLTAATGAFAMSGQAAAMRAARKMGAAVGAFGLAGQGATLRAARRLPASFAAFTLTGIAATLTKSGGAAHYVLTCDVGVFVLTGFPVGGGRGVLGPPGGSHHRRQPTSSRYGDFASSRPGSHNTRRF